jgi:hypothetical protein
MSNSTRPIWLGRIERSFNGPAPRCGFFLVQTGYAVTESRLLAFRPGAPTRSRAEQRPVGWPAALSPRTLSAPGKRRRPGTRTHKAPVCDRCSSRSRRERIQMPCAGRGRVLATARQWPLQTGCSPDFAADIWTAVLVPAGCPEEIVSLLQREIARLVTLPEIKERMATLGYQPVGNTPEECAKHIRTEATRWAKVIHDAGIKAR